VAGDEYALPFRKQMTYKISNGVRLSRARRPLDQHTARVLGSTCDSDLLRIGRLRKKDVSVGLARLTGAIGDFVFDRRRFEAHDIQKGPRQVLSTSKIFQYGLDGSRKTKGPSAKEKDRLSSDTGIVSVPLRSTGLDKFTSRRQLNYQALQKLRGEIVTERGEASLLQFVTAPSYGPSIHVWHRLE